MNTYNYAYNVSAILFLLVIWITYILKKTIKSRENKLYTVLIGVVLFTAVVNAADISVIILNGQISVWVGYVTSYLYFLLQILSAFLFALYVIALVDQTLEEESTIIKVIMLAPVVVSVLALMVNPVAGFLFYYDDANIYHRGELRSWFIGFMMLYIVFVVIYGAILREALIGKLKAVLIISGIVVFVFGLIHMMIPSLTVYFIGEAIAILVLGLSIQRPEEYLDLNTGLFNSLSFWKGFRRNIKAQEKNHLILIYVEDLSMIERALGVHAANQILREMGQYLEQQFAGEAYYLEGGLFSMMHHCNDEQDLLELMRSLDQRFMRKWKYGRGETDMNTRIMEIRLPEDAPDLEAVYSYAEYLRTLDASHKWVLYARTVDMQFIQRRADVEGALRRAIATEGFEMYYQPIYSVADRSIVTAEALVRLNDPVIGAVSPAEFIPIAEKSGLILLIGDMIFKMVFSYMKENDLLNKGIRYIEVNLSMVQCMQENLAARLYSMMQQYGIASNRINLEVTETAAAHSPRRLRENMHDLYERGVRFSLDDFGTGYSNIDSLMDLPLDMIKLDRSMIEMATSERKGEIVLSSAIALVKRMNMQIVAEGVETREQKEYLEELGVDYLQGYYFSRPLAATEFVGFVEEFNLG